MKLGIVGGGQLARMMALAAHPLGIECIVVDPSADACAGPVAEQLIVADYDDLAALRKCAQAVDAMTLDFENVPAPAMRCLAESLPVRPSADVLAIVQDRLEEKQFVRSVGVATPDFLPVFSLEELQIALKQLGGAGVLKTRRFGYDGKGQAIIRSSAEAAAAWAQLEGQELILEQFIDFRRELSVIVVRGSDGEIRTYPPAENQHSDGILVRSAAPAETSLVLHEQIELIGHTLAKALDYVGVMAVELFETKADELVVNELAPRVHNSGHWTIEGAVCSQFENHVRAVLGLPLGSTAARQYSVMVNYIGQMPSAGEVLSIPGAHLHDYLKQARPGRKVGHATVVDQDPKQALRRASEIAVPALMSAE